MRYFGLGIETRAGEELKLESLCGGQITLSILLIKLNIRGINHSVTFNFLNSAF